MNFPKTLIAILALLPALACASEGGFPLDKAPERGSVTSLQHGAKLFVNYCLNCHAAASMRYNRLKDLGLDDKQILENLLFTQDKVGGLMTTALRPADAKEWFGVVPPDLSVIARARASPSGSGPDYLYTYLRTFYKDDTTPTGWNNLVMPNVAMPHVMWQMQGIRTVKMVEQVDSHGKKAHVFGGFEQVTPGSMTPLQFDEATADLVAYMGWMAEPAAATRKKLGVWVLFLMSFFVLFAWLLSKSYWKDVK